MNNNFLDMFNQKKKLYCTNFTDTNFFREKCCIDCHQKFYMSGQIYSIEIEEYVIFGCCKFFEKFENKLDGGMCDFVDFYYVNRYKNLLKREECVGEKIFK